MSYGKALDILMELELNLNNSNIEYWINKEKMFLSLKQEAVHLNDEPSANSLWFVEQFSICKRVYIDCIDNMRINSFYKAWCDFERIEIKLRQMIANPVFDLERLQVGSFLKQVEVWQKIFPYKLYFSPGFLEISKHCSICDEKISPSFDCGHRIGRLYMGDICYHEVREAEMLEVSIVKEPVQKYSVLFYGSNENSQHLDNYDYSIPKFVTEHLHSPFSQWTFEWIDKRHSIEKFALLGYERFCPCGSSRKFGECCADKDSIVIPHISIVFAEDSNLQEIEEIIVLP